MLGFILAAVTASGFLSLQPGETVRFHIEDGRPVPDQGGRPDDPLDADQLQASLAVDLPGGPPGTVLTVVNNTADMVDYSASMALRGQTSPTSVCAVMANGRGGIEHWPDRLDALAIGNFHRHTGSEIVCK